MESLAHTGSNMEYDYHSIPRIYQHPHTFPQPERALISDEQRCSHLRHEKRELQGLPTPTPCAQRLSDSRHVGEAG